ncbi:minor capsid protein [bacterium]|nr:minor capsid protein [bacterium]
MSSEQFLIDAATRHQIFLLRYGSGRSKEANRRLNRLRQQINARLSQEPAAFQSQRLQDLLKDINALNVLAFRDVKTLVEMDSMKLAVSEADFNRIMINKVSTLPVTPTPEDLLVESVMDAPMSVGSGVGMTIAESLDQFGVLKGKQILKTITDNVVTGVATSLMAKAVDSLMRTVVKRQATSLIGTIINHVSSAARLNTYEKNTNLIGGYEWVATLDSKTTFVCMSRDGKKYDITSKVIPPAHYGCRSTTVPTIKPEFDLGLDVKTTRPAIGADGVQQVDSKTTYGGWLRTQNREFVDEALGIERSRLFRSGKLSLDKFVDPTGRVYTLPQLESMNPIVFSDF